MTLKNRLQRLTNKLKPHTVKVHYFGWANCTWSKSEGLIRQANELKEDFCKRVYQTSKKQYLWFD